MYSTGLSVEDILPQHGVCRAGDALRASNARNVTTVAQDCGEDAVAGLGPVVPRTDLAPAPYIAPRRCRGPKTLHNVSQTLPIDSHREYRVDLDRRHRVVGVYMLGRSRCVPHRVRIFGLGSGSRPLCKGPFARTRSLDHDANPPQVRDRNIGQTSATANHRSADAFWHGQQTAPRQKIGKDHVEDFFPNLEGGHQKSNIGARVVVNAPWNAASASWTSMTLCASAACLIAALQGA
jgi:hypothetical protein